MSKMTEENDYQEYRVVKTVTEYHHFTIEAQSQEEAEAIAESDDMGGCYCDIGGGASDTFVEVESVKVIE
tara:strand:- start:582 stop:791 length:210 start_codon:yes stop_codon:yes gene_type:complete